MACRGHRFVPPHRCFFMREPQSSDTVRLSLELPAQLPVMFSAYLTLHCLIMQLLGHSGQLSVKDLFDGSSFLTICTTPPRFVHIRTAIMIHCSIGARTASNNACNKSVAISAFRIYMAGFGTIGQILVKDLFNGSRSTSICTTTILYIHVQIAIIIHRSTKA